MWFSLIFLTVTIAFSESDFIFSNWAGDIELSSVYQNEYSPSIDRNSDESYSYLNFDGVDDYLDIPASSDYDFSDEDAFSLSFWVNFNDVSSVQYIFSAEDMFWVFLNDDGEIKFRYRNHPSGNWPEFSSSFSPQIETWYHIIITTDNGSSKIYINGSLDEESSVSISGLTANGNNTRNLELGARKVYSSDPLYFLNGSLDDVAMWNKSISASEVSAIYNQGTIINLSSNTSSYNSASDLVCYWRFNEGQGSTANDLSSNNNNAVINGASWNEENASSIRVAVVSSAYNSTKEAVAAQLNDDTYFDFFAVTLTVDQADEISEISDYDIIIIGGSGYANGGYTASFYSTLNTYLQNGGGILSTGWFVHETMSTWNGGGQVASDLAAITPYVDDGTYHYQTPGQISILQTNHAVTSGISDFNPTCNYTEYEIAIDPGAEKLGGLVGTDNANTIIVHDHGSNGRTGYLGGMYMANTGYGNSNMRSGVEDQLLEQMVYWLAGGESNQNNPPIASSFVSSSVEDVSSTIDLISQDADNDPISYTIIDSPFHGEVVFITDSTVTYSPYNNFFGLDSFKYVAYDGEAYSESAMVTIEVTEVNDKPIAMGDHFMVAEDDTLHGELHAEDGDYFPTQQEIQNLTYSITLSTLNGTLSVIDTSGEFTYTPDVNFFGADSFLFSVTDNGTTDGVADFLSDTAMIHLFVEPMNDAPVLSAFADTLMHEDSTLVLTVFASDIDNAELSVYAYSSQNRVSAFVEDTLLYITPDADWNGTAEIVVVANDNMSRASDVEEFTVEVIPVNDPPFFTMDHFHAMGDITSGLEHWLYADDIDSDIFFTLEGAPSWLTLDGSKMVGDPDQDGEYVFTLSVSDSEYVVSEQFIVHIADHRPEILSLRDVPNDQGKQMQIVWKPGQVDPSLLFTQFSTWRKVNPDSMQQDTTDLWDFITTVPWIGTEDEYSLVVPTLGDSTAHGVHHSMFRVTAHTEDVELYHVSEPVTGFSIDNLHPTVPQGLMALESGSSVILQWATQIEEDFSYHNIYRNDLNSFDPAMVFTTTDSFYVDEEGTQGSYEYWITAVDSAGNESDASDIAAVVLSASEQATVPTVFALEQNYPNPFNPSTQIRYALPEATSVVITVYDMMGRKVRTLVQDTQSAGYHTALWNATNDRGLPVSAGMYIYTLQAGDHHHMKKMVLLK